MRTPSQPRSKRHVTFSGRIVYDRKKHYFKITDITRILRHLRKVTPEYNFIQLLALYIELFDFLMRTLPDLFDLALSSSSQDQATALGLIQKFLSDFLGLVLRRDIQDLKIFLAQIGFYQKEE